MAGTRRRVVASLVLTALPLLGSIPAAPSSSACAGGHLGVRWGAFPSPLNDFAPVVFYYAAEGAGNVPVTIFSTGDDCEPPREPVTANYRVGAPPAGTPRPADSADVPERVGQTQPLWDHQGGAMSHSDTVLVPADPSPVPEPVVEQAQALITASSGTRSYPFDVPFYVLDTAGSDRVAFGSAGPYVREERYLSLQVPVFRAGPATENVSFPYSVAGTGASAATPGQDFTVTSPNPLPFAAGQRVAMIELTLAADGRTEPAEEALITLTDPGTVLPATDQVTTTVRILDAPGASAPVSSRLHHPRQKVKYPTEDYRIREVHIFTDGGGGPPVARADFALRMNRRKGKCSWWNGKRFQKGGRKDFTWVRNDGQYEPDFFYIRVSALRPSTGAIRSYTAYSRAISADQAVEASFQKGRNANTFEVLQAKAKG